MPALPKLTLFGLALAYAMSPFRSLKGAAAFTAITCGPVATLVMPTRSFAGS